MPYSNRQMHTYGMPTRLMISGYSELSGTFLEQKAEAEKSHDHICRMVLLEPRGHADMFGAILRSKTELTKTGEAHMGIPYIHGHGYSYMCGHATIALCRFLIDKDAPDVFPRRTLGDDHISRSPGITTLTQTEKQGNCLQTSPGHFVMH